MIFHSRRPRLGQHFLHEKEVIQRIITAIAPQPGQHLVEIGPGKGALTFPLLQQRCQLEVIELDTTLVQLLKQKTINTELFRLHHADALKFDFNQLITTQPLRICGNLPYNISTVLLFHLLDYANAIQDMTFMLQKEVVERMVAVPNTAEYGRLSVMLQYRCQIEFLFAVAPRSFYPPPQVDSAVVRLVPYESLPVMVINQQHFFQIVTQAFSQRRKTLRNSLKGLLDTQEIEAIGIDSQRRAETLQLLEFAQLANYFTVNK
ncbi:MAG: 16S rRNA (adenine(1518)-N(6)/adenine(1519)-N(6))-dimethyltransferase RsmA [Thioploca sp.]|nr:16S rRNA (adenine(1518)-N(6)/adenine(1519)-N(6))-dimethyltransferase RsmA [Thioploca sp.]